MVQQELENGVTTILLTPHFNAHDSYPFEFLEKRNAAYDILLDALSHIEVLPKFLLGAEVQFCSGMSQWEQLRQLTIADTGYLLLEMPAGRWDEYTYRELEMIYTEQGITPILAHIERYVGRFDINKILRYLSDLPVLLQVNCSFINEKPTRRTALKLINAQKIHVIGSDCHSSQWRCPCIAETRDLLNTYATKEALNYLSITQNAILCGEDLFIANSSL